MPGYTLLYTALSVAAILGSAFVTFTMVRLALRSEGNARVFLVFVALLWLGLFVRGLVQLIQSGF